MFTQASWLGSPRVASTLQAWWDITGQCVSSVAVPGPDLVPRLAVPHSAHSWWGCSGSSKAVSASLHGCAFQNTSENKIQVSRKERYYSLHKKGPLLGLAHELEHCHCWVNGTCWVSTKVVKKTKASPSCPTSSVSGASCVAQGTLSRWG